MCVYVCMHVCVGICVYVYGWMYIFIHVCMHVYKASLAIIHNCVITMYICSTFNTYLLGQRGTIYPKLPSSNWS